jgi:8-oxo-dGTP pyrophosphatase MutT (NUDIX family)
VTLAVTPFPGATVMVVRDGDDGLEVLVHRRSDELEFVPGAHVFPGGKVEPEDNDPHPTAGPCPTDAEASAQIGVDSGGLAYWVAAARELYEEAGLLLADGPTGPAGAHRDAVERGERHFADVCADHGLALRLGDLRYFGHWTTPHGAPRRYSTRFFVAPTPPGQEFSHDSSEAVDGEWIRPRAALDAFAEGTWLLITPTERSLHALATFDDVAGLLDHLDTHPPLTDDHGGRRVALPHEVAAARQESPT